MAETKNDPPREAGGATGPQRRRLDLRPAVFALVIVAVSGLALIALLKPPSLFGDATQREIVAKRAANFAYFNAGMMLPGTPDLATLDARLKSHGLSVGAPVLIRIFKKEFELELWMARDGRYHRFETYPICRWSGRLGPKLATGDRQAPEGFYTVAADQLNPNSRWHRSFNLGFPNPFDVSYGRSGSALMVHGGCSSVGCYAMTNAVMDEIWRLVTAALAQNQKRFQVQVFPFRMNEATLLEHASHPDAAFWRQLHRGSEVFEQTLLPPVVTHCGGAYRFAVATGKPELTSLLQRDCSPRGVSATGLGKKTL
jgi:murein L,D-transpeptidase YafK